MVERIAIVDYGSGNLRSAQKALQRAARETGRATRIDVTADPSAIADADRIVLPGVGAFAACRAGLDSVDGAVDALEHATLVRGRPFLGVCVGMQLLATTGLEFGETPGLGWIPGSVRRLAPDDPSLRIPHIGWNEVRAARRWPAMAAVFGGEPDFYFVHSFCFDVENKENIMAVCEYGQVFPAAVARDNILGVQFHPEKSQGAGLAFLAAFLAWRP